jgi:hypothetical protein
MGKPNPPLLNYSKKNLKKVSNSIYRNLTEDLLPLKKYIPGNKKNAMYGHCHTASGCLYKIFGSKNVHLFRAMDKNHLYHWWVQDMNNNVIDLTQSQYSDSYVSKLYMVYDCIVP